MHILPVADLFHPVDNLAIELFLNGNVRHGGGRRGPMPVLLTRSEPDHVTGANLLDRPSPALGQAAARGDNQGLTKRMSVPCRPRAGLEGYAGSLNARAGSGA